jgi:antitoxin (DNA-binding transcriptional repressor) of toxin-antitoxin stability system
MIEAMDTLPISRFKATCLAALERVHQTGRPLLVTKRGVPIAQVIAPPPPDTKEDAFGALRGTAEELDDIVTPLPEDAVDERLRDAQWLSTRSA